MTRFENKLCPVCRIRFTEKSDIVVCPECGTPHHRACYLTENKCSLSELHASGWSWEGALPDEQSETSSEPKAEEKSVSDLFGEINEDENSEFAPYNREARMFEEQLGDENPFRELFRTLSDKEIGEDNVSMHELVAYSATSVYHYGKAFSAFRGLTDGKKHKVFFNFCGGVFAPIFQFYRKMNFFGLSVLIVLMVPSVLEVFMPEQFSGTTLYMIVYGVQVARILITILLCVFGDYIYYRHCVKNIVSFRGSYKGDTKSDEYFMELYELGRPTFLGGFVGLIALVFANICLMSLFS